MAAKSTGPLSIPGNGVLVMGADTLLNWAQFGTVLAEVEVDGDESATDGNRIVVRRARAIRLVPGWTDERILSWGLDCIDRAVRIHLAAALYAANLHKVSRRLGGMGRISDSIAARRVVDELERLDDRDDIDSSSWLRSAIDGAIDAASRLAAPPVTDVVDQEEGDYGDDDSTEPVDDEGDDYDGSDVPHYTETAAWWEARRSSDEARAAKYAAKAARWTSYCAGECVAIGADSKVQSDSYAEAAAGAQAAEDRLQAERLGKLVGV